MQHRLQVGEALALSFLGATGDPQVAKAYCDDCLPDQGGALWVQQVLDRYWTYLGDGPARPLDIAWLHALRQHSGLSAAVPRREAAPAAVTWLVTLGCNRHCPYCFYLVTHHPVSCPDSPPDATFPLADVKQMVSEMAQIGAADLYLTGGEPLLRKDLVEVIQTASACHVRTHLFTKYTIDGRLAGALARAGLCSATVSLDDARPAQAAALAGSRDYLQEAKGTISSLLEVGILLEVNAVATRVNLPHLELLVQLLIRLGVPKLVVSPFRPPQQRRLAGQLVPPVGALQELVAQLRPQYAPQIELEAGSAAVTEPNSFEPNGQRLLCEVGLRTLSVLPDGQVTRCHYLPGEARLLTGSLQRQTLLEVWEGETLAALWQPDMAAYRDTACDGCEAFHACNARGRCYFTSIAHADRLHAPDAFCPKERRP